MNRYDILLGKKYSEQKDQKEKPLFGSLQEDSGVTTNNDIIQQRGIACTILIEKKEYQGRFLDYSLTQDDNQTRTFNLTLELPGLIDTNIFYGNIIRVNYSLSGVLELISCYSQAISANFNVNNCTTHISISGVEAVNEVCQE